MGGGDGGSGIGAGVAWLGRVAIEGVRLAAGGSIVPTLWVSERTQGRPVDAMVGWRPALVDSPTIAALGAAMPGTVGAIDGRGGREITSEVITAVVASVTVAASPLMIGEALSPPATLALY